MAQDKAALPDIHTLRGKSPAALEKALARRGYTPSGTTPTATVFSCPDMPGHVITLSVWTAEERAFARLCQEHPDNPYLPHLQDFRQIDGLPPVTIAVREPLIDLYGDTKNETAPMRGCARALALLISGDEAHRDAHNFMLQDPAIKEAAQAIVLAMANSIETSQTALYYDHGMDESVALDERESNAILFRNNSADPDHPAYSPVFSAPFKAGPIRDEAHRAALRQDIAILKKNVGLDDEPTARQPRRAPPSSRNSLK